jgi:hypothetical protein
VASSLPVKWTVTVLPVSWAVNRTASVALQADGLTPLGLGSETLQKRCQDNPAALSAETTPDGLTETPETVPLQA